jgi:hypothetical protein
MKTLKEILLERHQATDTKLDSIRESVLAAECSIKIQNSKLKNREAVVTVAGFASLIWRELIWPSRRIWAGFAFGWFAIALLKLNGSDSEPTQMVAKPKATDDSNRVLMVWREQQRIMAELAGPRETVDAEEPKKADMPKPRSQRIVLWRVT